MPPPGLLPTLTIPAIETAALRRDVRVTRHVAVRHRGVIRTRHVAVRHRGVLRTRHVAVRHRGVLRTRHVAAGHRGVAVRARHVAIRHRGVAARRTQVAVGRRGAVAVKSTTVMRRGPSNPTTGPSLTVSHSAPSSPPMPCRRRRPSTCAGIGPIRPRLAAIGTSANSSTTMLARANKRLVSRWAIPPSRASTGAVRMSIYHLAQITVKTTSSALRSSCSASCQGKGET